MPAINPGRANLNREGKGTGKRRVKRVKKNAPVTVAPADRTQERATTRNVQVAKSKSLSPDRQDTKRSPQQQQHDKAFTAKNIADTRRRVVVKRGAGSGTRAIKRELEGKGVIADVFNNLGERAAKNTTTLPGGASKMGGIGGSGTSRVIERATKDIVGAPAAVIPSLYQPIAGAYEAIPKKFGGKGDTRRIKKVADDFKQTDPIYNTGAAIVEKAAGNDKAAASHWEKAKKSASDHPGLLALEVYGAGKTLDTAAGTAARTGVAGKKVKAATAKEGAPKTVPGTRITEPRIYPKGVIQGQTARYKERIAREETAALRKRAEDVRDSDPDMAHELDAKANRKDPDRVSSREIRRQVDERVDANEQLRRIGRAEATHQVKQILKPVKANHRALVPLVAQRIVKADVTDLRAYVREIQAELPHMSKARQAQQRELVARVNQALKDPAGLDKVTHAARQYVDATKPLQDQLVAHGMLDAEQASRAAVMPYAVRRMGARHTSEHNKAAAENAKATLDNVRSRVDRLERTREQLVGRHRLERGQAEVKEPQRAYYVGARRFNTRAEADAHAKTNGGSVQVKARTVEESKRMGDRAKNERALRSARNELKNAEAKYREAHARRGTAELVDASGKPVTTAEIKAHMTAHGEEPAAFITQAPNRNRASAFNIRSEKAQSVSNARRTGQSTREGTFDTHPDVLGEQAARARGLADAADGFRAFIADHAVVGSSGKVKTVANRKQADAVLAELHAIPGAPRYRVVRVQPFGARQEQLRSLLEDVDSPDHMSRSAGGHSPLTAAIEDALDTGKGGDGPFAFIPEESASQLQLHMRSMGPGAAGMAGQVLGQAFRKTVLATSPTWLAGNVIEGAFRTGLHRAGIGSYIIGRHAVRAAGPEATVRTIGGGHLSSAQRQTMHRSAEQFAGTNLEGVAQALGKFWRSPGPKQAAQVWNHWTDLVMRQVSGSIEQAFQTAILGAELRRSPLMDGHTVKLSKAAMDDAARGLKNTDAQRQFGRAIDRAYGRYSKLGPTERAMISTYTPFYRWAANATRFLVDVLPRDHPTVTALLASAQLASEDWRKQHGLAKYEDGAMPDFLMGSIPTGGGGHLRLSRYLPFSLGTDPLGTMAGQVLPQASAVLAAMRGQDWRGVKLKGRNGGTADDFDKALAAAHALATSTVPILGQAERVASKGPGALNPFAPVKPAQKKVKVRRPKSSGYDNSYDPGAATSGAYDPSYAGN